MLLVGRLEEEREATDRLRRAQKQKPVRLERVVEHREHLLLQTRFQVDQQVPTADEVDTRERRITDEILPRKDDYLAQRLVDPIAALLLDEKPPQAFGGHILRQALRVETLAGFVEQRVIQVGGEHVELPQTRRFLRRFHEGHGNRVRLLAGRAAEHPDAHRIVATLLQELGKHFACKHHKGFRVAEEAGDADQHVGVERVELLGVTAEKCGVVLRRVRLVQHHAAGDAPLDGGGLVE